MVTILDTTLREGEQTPNVKFAKEQKIKIARLLDDFCVDIIEIGHPIISDYDKECVKAVASLNLKAETLAHARALKEDIDAVVDCGTDWVGIFCGINKFALKHKLHRTKKEVINMITDSIKYAKDNGLKVRYTIEDATRTDFKDIIEIGKLAKQAGANILSLADTVGVTTPEQFHNLITKIKKRVDIDLEVHCHNDLGLALANSLVAYKTGVKTIDVTINGLGERAGLTSLAELCLALKLLYKVRNNWKLKELPKLSKIVEKFSGISMDTLRPIIGENVFTHTADLHQKATKKNPTCYESIDPRVLRRKRKFSQIIRFNQQRWLSRKASKRRAG